jgi:hypothetical protein
MTPLEWARRRQTWSTPAELIRRQSWSTPPELIRDLTLEFGVLYDPCPINGTGGLEKDWPGKVFVNPPFNTIPLWLSKAAQELEKRTDLCVFLLPSRTDRPWFHDVVLKHAEIRWIRGRVKFCGATTNPPFACFIAIFRTNRQRKA